MPNLASRALPWICGPVLAIGLKWLFDRVLWDWLTKWLDRLIDFERVAAIVAMTSYLLPLALSVLTCVKLFPGESVDPGLPSLRKRPWQSKPLIVSVLIVIAAVVAGISYGRLFGLPSIVLPAAFSSQ